ncbi:cobalamin biosynthesis protein CobQ [Rhodobacteraceae bacterium WD3A24]|nr:cobalamin biosynthesis protein CobQ [Rhodobacteraceae bacterium WD3A24]
MNTPAHIALSLAVLGRRAGAGETAAILVGALAPDAMLYAAHFDMQAGGAVTALTPVFNALPVWSGVLVLGLALRRPWLWLLAASALLHIGFDLPLHAEDARAHLWPLADWRFYSPVSFWDVDHHGRIAGITEGVLVAVCLIVLWRGSRGALSHGLLAALAAVYAVTFLHFWGHAFHDAHWAVW